MEKENIKKLYKNYVEQNMIPTPEYLKSAKKFSKEIENFSKMLDDKQNEKLNLICEYMNDMVNEQCIQVFSEAYCLGVNLTTEALINKQKNR